VGGKLVANITFWVTVVLVLELQVKLTGCYTLLNKYLAITATVVFFCNLLQP